MKELIKLLNDVENQQLDYITAQCCDDYSQHKREMTDHQKKWAGKTLLDDFYNRAFKLIDDNTYPEIEIDMLIDGYNERTSRMYGFFWSKIQNIDARKKTIQHRVEMDRAYALSGVAKAVYANEQFVADAINSTRKMIENGTIEMSIEQSNAFKKMLPNHNVTNAPYRVLGFAQAYEQLKHDPLTAIANNKPMYNGDKDYIGDFIREYFVMADKYIEDATALVNECKKYGLQT